MDNTAYDEWREIVGLNYSSRDEMIFNAGYDFKSIEVREDLLKLKAQDEEIKKLQKSALAKKDKIMEVYEEAISEAISFIRTRCVDNRDREYILGILNNVLKED